jgi:hypothetical protein
MSNITHLSSKSTADLLQPRLWDSIRDPVRHERKMDQFLRLCLAKAMGR